MTAFYDFQHTVSADEIDAQQHVHNLRYLQWTLWAAGAHTRACGWDTKAELARGRGWVVRNHEAKYCAAARADEKIVVRTWVSQIEKFASRRKYVICRPADKTVLTRVETRWVYVDLHQHKVLSIPDNALPHLHLVAKPPPLPWSSIDDGTT